MPTDDLRSTRPLRPARWRRALTAALLICSFGAAAQPFNIVRFDPPLPAPAFELDDLVRQPARLADFRGGYVLLNFWATWCPPCVKEMPSMQRLDDRYDTLTVVAVSVDDADSAEHIETFVERLGLRFPILRDPRSDVADVYGASALPSTFLIDPQGRVVAAAKGERDWDSAPARQFFDRTVAP